MITITKTKMLYLLIGVFLITFLALKINFSKPSEVSLGYIVSERCEKIVHEYWSQWEKEIDIEYLEINNLKGGFYTYFTEYVVLNTKKFDKEFLVTLMNGSLKKCGRDSIIESKLDNKHLLPELKSYVKTLKLKGVEGSLIVEIKGSEVLIHENSLYTRDMVRSYHP